MKNKNITIKRKKKCIIIVRVSTAKQKKGTSPKTQLTWGKKKAENLKAEIIKTIEDDMSGEIFLKKYRGEILDAIKKEKVDYVLVYTFDRFTRNLSQGTVMMNDIIKLGCSIVTPSEIIDKNSDLLMPNIQMAFSEHTRKNIVHKSKEGIVSLLKEGKYPFIHIPIGIKINKNKNSKSYRKARFDETYKGLITDLFTSFIDEKNYAKVTKVINKKYETLLEKSLTRDRVKKTLTNPIYIGYIPYSGDRYGKDGSNTKPNHDLIAIDENLFNKSQQIVKIISKSYQKTGKTLKNALADLIENNGLDVVINNLDNMIKICCPKCGNINLKKNGPDKDIINGQYTPKFICENCENNYQFRIPTAKQIKHLKSLDPRRCPKCGSADDFTVSKSMLSDYLQVVCNKCQYEWFAPISDYKFKQLVKKN